jgi:lipoate-protein ligase A
MILEPRETDPFRNLAVEEYLLTRTGTVPVMFLLWQARDSVIVGKNQDPWLECDPPLIEKEGGLLARRLSGGGAVFHDLGNLNYAFITRREEYDCNRQFQVVVKTLRRLGVTAEITKHHALLVRDRKISGTAFCYRKTAVLHHGTLLVCADLDRMQRWLRPSHRDETSRAIRSIPSPVMNLEEAVPALTVDKLKEALRESFQDEYDPPPASDDEKHLDFDAIEQLRARYASREWRFRTGERNS